MELVLQSLQSAPQRRRQLQADDTTCFATIMFQAEIAYQLLLSNLSS